MAGILRRLASSLQAKKSLSIIIAAALVVELISAFQYYYMRNVLTEEMEKRAEMELTMKAIILKGSINISELALQGHIQGMLRNLSYPDSMYTLARQIVTAYPMLSGCGFAFVPGYYPEKGRLFEPYVQRTDSGIVQRQAAGEHHDYTTLSFYQKAQEAQEPSWIEPYMNELTGQKDISYILPVYDSQDDLIAMFGIDISTKLLGDTLNHRHVYPSSFDLLLTEDGHLIAGPTDPALQDVVEQVVRLINDSTVEKTPSTSGRSRVATFYDTKTRDEADVFFANMKGVPHWQIAVVCYDNEVYGQLRRSRLFIMLLMLGAFTVLGFIIYRFLQDDRRLQRVQLQQERIGSELRIARDIQGQMLPEAYQPSSEDSPLDICGSLVPAKEVGGDLYDYFLRDGKLFFCIGDVSGKGIPSAMLMAVTHSLFRSASSHENNPAHIMRTMNEVTCQGNHSNMFVTLFVGVLDLPTGHLRYCDAGHDCPFVLSPGNPVPSQLSCKPHLPIGVFDDMKYDVQETRLLPGSILFLYTDGLTEAKNPHRQQFGLKRVGEVLARCAGEHLLPKQILQAVSDELRHFVKDAGQSDDQTLLAIHYTPRHFESILTETLTLTNDVREVAKLSDFMKSVAKQLQLEPSLARQLRLAVEEAVVNVMDYAYPAGTTGEVTVKVMSDGHMLKVMIVDNGVPFDPTVTQKADTTLSAEERQIGGLGILLVRELMDVINYERTDGQNVLTLAKAIESGDSLKAVSNQ